MYAGITIMQTNARTALYIFFSLPLFVTFIIWSLQKQTTENIHAQTTQSTFYVDCAAGSDTNNGTTPGTAWKSLAKANTATLRAGDNLYYKRGCTWNGRLKAQWSGTAAAPITIGAYGSGALPIIQSDPSLSSSRVEISGSYQIVENLDVRTINAKTDPNCQNQTIGYFVGFNFLGNSSFNIVRNSKASYHTIGVHITDNSHHNKILNNEIFMNSVMNQLTTDASPDLGAWGIDLRGDDNEIAYNYLHDNNGWCAYDFSIKPGNAIELYNADRSFIHHNKVVNDRVFSEVGHDSTHTSNDNTWAYNIHIGKEKTSRFLVLHGVGNAFGPVLRSKIYNNSVYLYGPTSTGIGEGESGTIVKNNIIAVTSHATNTSAIVQSNNIFWNPSGTPLVNTLGPNDKKADPKFVNPASGDLHLQASSPAINAGTTVQLSINPLKDFDGVIVPQGGTVDIGAFEFGGSVPTGQVTITAVPSVFSTSIPTGAETRIALKLLLHGIGKAGDNSNPTSSGNMNPLHTQRQATVEFYNSTNILVVSKIATVTFDAVEGSFKNVVPMGTLPAGSYIVKMHVPHYLRRTVPGIVTIAPDKPESAVLGTLITGDSNDDNALSILDYNGVLDCFSDLSPARNCTDPNKKAATDLNDDGNVNQFDYNLFLRELSVQAGQ